MPFSHHSHSGQFCPGHAEDKLEDIVRTAISKGFKVFCLSEHMPRHEKDRYPEEMEAGTTLQQMIMNESAYYAEAHRLRDKYSSQISLPIGFESDWCGEHSAQLITASLHNYEFDFYIGSIHHVGSVPIDYDEQSYECAKYLNGGSDENLFEAYFDEQLTMLQTLKPIIIGHFDLIRLKSAKPDCDWRTMKNVWQKILRNLDFVASYGGVLELNTAAWRKGLLEPYPTSEICQEWLKRGGKFCLSDDSHGVAQVGTNYSRLLPFFQKNKITELVCIELLANTTDKTKDSNSPSIYWQSVPVNELSSHPLLMAT